MRDWAEQNEVRFSEYFEDWLEAFEGDFDAYSDEELKNMAYCQFYGLN